jgi:Uma2 family endonuclease
VPLEEYLHASYEPDCEYVDDELLDRNVRELDHSDLQTTIAAYLGSRRRELGVHIFVALRVQVSAKRFRVPDICIVAGAKPTEQILTHPPLAVIEILSKDDRMTYMQTKIEDYLLFGVPSVWVVDPRQRRAWIYTAEGSREAKDLVLRTTNPVIELPLGEIFRDLD